MYNTINMYYGIQGQGKSECFERRLRQVQPHQAAVRGLRRYFLEDGTFLKIDAITLG
ncbi:MAG: hypothetical protein ACLR6J_13040 [Parabacteroides merdae]